MIYVIPSDHYFRALRFLDLRPGVLWYVSCGCSYHGDHGACEDYICDGCVHPVGVSVSADTESAADTYSGMLIEDIEASQVRVFEIDISISVREK